MYHLFTLAKIEKSDLSAPRVAANVSYRVCDAASSIRAATSFGLENATLIVVVAVLRRERAAGQK
jgi:hypothetical protein